MELIVDANILFSGLIRNNITADLLFNRNLTLFSPDFVIEEFTKYWDFLVEKSSKTTEQFIQIQHMLKGIINVVPKEEYSDFIKIAKEISPDIDDTMYFALALKLKCGIWSNDKKLKMQNKVKIYSTEELLKEVK